ncbi:rRNA-processing protein bfr2 [Ceratobasidium sp. 423]|nr:rRNA-processing protein bfr2 [Ceratobasidium sp. 423]
MSPLSLAEQIAQLEDTAPPDVDIERFDGGGLGEEEAHNDLAAGRGHYLDVGPSSLRKQKDALVDPKYEGVRTSRSQLYEFDDKTDEDIGSGSVASESQDESNESGTEDEENPEEPNGDSKNGEEIKESGDDREEGGDSETSDAAPEFAADNLTAALKKTREADKEKGRAIIQQRVLWDSLVETRIRLHKAATATNRLPPPNALAPYVTAENGREAVRSFLKEVLSFSDELLTLRKRLTQVNEPEIDVPSAKKRKMDSKEEAFEQQTREVTTEATEMDAVYHPSCVRTLQKWSNKIAAVTPASLSARSGKSFRGGATRSTVELVEDALGESGGKAVGRTRVRRSVGTRIGTQISPEADGAEGDAEVFDDLDFYQALLRDVIDSRTGAEDDWMARQRMKKAKKVVDTKASKGRKLRYEVHEKLQNFMAPVPTATWHEEQIDELFANLLVSGGPIHNERGLVARQATTTAGATPAQTTAQVTTASETSTRSSATSSASTSSAATSSTATTSATTTAQSSTSTHTTRTHTTHTTHTTSNTSSSSSTTTSSSTTSSASATSTASSNIFSKSSPYFGYAVGVLVVVCIFGALLLVLVIRFIVQKFTKKPNPPPITANAGAWRYSQDTELYSPGAVPDSANNTASTAPLTRHKGLGAEMGEAQAFLSTESVALYPPAKYTDEESNPRRHSRSLSNASSSQATTTPYVQRRPLSFLHSPPATHPAFIVDRDQESNSSHGHLGTVELEAVPERSQEGQPSTTAPGPSMANLLLARAGHSDAYRQPTLGSTTMLSRAASTASAYSQPSAIHTPPPMPELPLTPMPVAPQAQVQPRPQARDLSPDLAAALSTMQNNPPTDTILGDGLIHSEDNHPTLRPTPGRMGWGRQAPSSIHSHSDLFFGDEPR